MLLQLPKILNADELREARTALAHAPWDDGRSSAGEQSAQVKNNQQLSPDHELTKLLQALVLAALKRSPAFFSAALPKHIFPPLFNRYGGAHNHFGKHVDNAVRLHHASGQRIRTDISATLFLAEPNEYDGGELAIEDSFGRPRVKLAAGDLVIYPSCSVHQVLPVTRGTRLACVFWIESLVRSDEQRRLLHDLDQTLMALRNASGDNEHTVRLSGTYHNLLRLWADS